MPGGSITATVVIGSVAAALWIGANSWLWTGLTLLLALPAGFALAAGLLAVIHATTDPVRRYQAQHGHKRFSVQVSDPESRAWRLCHRAEQLAAGPAPTPGRGGGDDALWAAVAFGEERAAKSLSRPGEPESPRGC